MKSRNGLVILAIALSGMGCLALGTSSGVFSLASAPSTQLPFAHYATRRMDVTPSARKSISDDEDLVVAVDDFTYTGLIKASATNPYAPPKRRPPAKKKSVPVKRK